MQFLVSNNFKNDENMLIIMISDGIGVPNLKINRDIFFAPLKRFAVKNHSKLIEILIKSEFPDGHHLY